MFLYYTILIQFSSLFGDFFHLFYDIFHIVRRILAIETGYLPIAILVNNVPQPLECKILLNCLKCIIYEDCYNLVHLKYSLKLLRVYSKKQQNRYKLSILLTFPL